MMAPCTWVMAVLCWLAALLGAAECRLSGYHVDDESCSGLIQNNRTEQVRWRAHGLGMVP